MAWVVGEQPPQMLQAFVHRALLHQGVGGVEPPGGVVRIETLGLAEAGERLLMLAVVAVGDAKIREQAGMRAVLGEGIAEQGDGPTVLAGGFHRWNSSGSPPRHRRHARNKRG